jgi:hypothetical protein
LKFAVCGYRSAVNVNLNLSNNNISQKPVFTRFSGVQITTALETLRIRKRPSTYTSINTVFSLENKTATVINGLSSAYSKAGLHDKRFGHGTPENGHRAETPISLFTRLHDNYFVDTL